MTRALALALAAAFVFAAVTLACEGPPWPAQAPSSPTTGASGAEANAAPIGDAGATNVRPFHTMTLARCALDVEDCARAHASTDNGPAYLVAFGSGTGSTRTREQAMADLYRELRDRTASGTHLVGRPRHLVEPEGGAPPAPDEGETRRGGPVENDPLVEASFELMTIVDHEGAVTVDVAPSNGACKVALGLPEIVDASPGLGRCFLQDEAPQRRMGGSGRGR